MGFLDLFLCRALFISIPPASKLVTALGRPAMVYRIVFSQKQKSDWRDRCGCPSTVKSLQATMSLNNQDRSVVNDGWHWPIVMPGEEDTMRHAWT